MADDFSSGNISGGNISSAVNLANTSSKQLFGAQVVKATLDYMNADSHGQSGKSADYDFQTKVLEGGFALKGNMISNKV